VDLDDIPTSLENVNFFFPRPFNERSILSAVDGGVCWPATAQGGNLYEETVDLSHAGFALLQELAADSQTDGCAHS